MLILTVESVEPRLRDGELAAVEFLVRHRVVDRVRVETTGSGFAVAQTLRGVGVNVEEFHHTSNPPSLGISGATIAVGPTNLNSAVAVLMSCGHGHNFVVNQDKAHVYCSEAAVECLRKELRI